MPSTDLVQDAQHFLQWATSSFSAALITLLGAIALWHVVPFFINTAALAIPGPLAAKFTDYWLLRQAMKGKRFEVVHEMHKKHGKFVRIAPNHISIADPQCLDAVYGHGKGTLKSEYYDGESQSCSILDTDLDADSILWTAFVPPKPAVRGLFNTRDRAEHTRKRKVNLTFDCQVGMIFILTYIYCIRLSLIPLPPRALSLLSHLSEEKFNYFWKDGTNSPRLQKRAILLDLVD